MNDLRGIYAIWLRELKVYFREYSRIIGSVLTPLLWLLIVGKGIGASIGSDSFQGVDYSHFIFPGILCMTVLFQSVFYGLYIVWDRKIDFLKEVLASPLNRSSIFIGKVLGGVTDSMIQVSIILFMGHFLFEDLVYTPYSIFLTYVFLFLLAVAMTSIGLIIGSRMESTEGFSLVTSLVVFPMYFLSGALFLKETLPTTLYYAAVVNPVSYAVDAIRFAMIPQFEEFGLITDFIVLSSLCSVLICIGTWFFKTMKL